MENGKYGDHHLYSPFKDHETCHGWTSGLRFLKSLMLWVKPSPTIHLDDWHVTVDLDGMPKKWNSYFSPSRNKVQSLKDENFDVRGYVFTLLDFLVDYLNDNQMKSHMRDK